MSDPQYRLIERKIRVRTRRVRTLEKYRLRRKEAYIQKRDTDCNRHMICRWVNRIKEQYAKDSDGFEDNDSEEDSGIEKEEKSQTEIKTEEMEKIEILHRKEIHRLQNKKEVDKTVN